MLERYPGLDVSDLSQQDMIFFEEDLCFMVKGQPPPPPFCLKSSQRRQTRSTNMTENISYKSSYSGNREAERHRKHSMSILNDLTQYYESFEALQRTYSPYRPMVRRLKKNTWFHSMCHGKSILIVNITKTIPLVCFIWKPHHYL